MGFFPFYVSIIVEDCIVFKSSEPFTVALGTDYSSETWGGTVQVSVDGTNWEECSAATGISAGYADGIYNVFFRGENDRTIGSKNKSTKFVLFGNSSVSCPAISKTYWITQRSKEVTILKWNHMLLICCSEAVGF